MRQLLLQIAEGLAFLHSQHIAHLDIKPANLLLSAAWPQVDAKLCDFGISRLILPGEEIHEIAGTPDYIGMYPAARHVSCLETQMVDCPGCMNNSLL